MVNTRSATACEGVIFSKDRALQLHALLTSYHDKARPPQPLHVIYTTSSPSHQRAYDAVIRCFSRVHFVRETLFRDNLIRLIASIESRAIVFLVDDMMFVNDVDFNELCSVDLLETVPTLRLGRTVTRNYPWQCEQRRPALYGNGDRNGLFQFRWSQGELDWHYPLSLDGHIFQRRELLELTRQIRFRSPNTYEGALQQYQPFFVVREGLCYARPRALAIPWNRVQDEFRNRCGDVGVEFLLERWTNGYQIDTERLYGLTAEAAHQDVPPTFIPRSDCR